MRTCDCDCEDDVGHDEPGYLKALRRSQERQQRSKGGREGRTAGKLSPAEMEATRWAREVAGPGVSIAPNLEGARYAFLYQPKTYDQKAPVLLEGVASQEALVTRIEAASGFGDKVLGCYDVASARPLEAGTEQGRTTLTPGTARPIGKVLTPEQMVRQAAKMAEKRGRERKPEGKGGKGRR